MELIKATSEEFDTVKRIVKNTIEVTYPNYYPKGAVDFFLAYHSDEAMKQAILNGTVYLIKEDNRFVGTGSLEGNEIKRLFVLPEYQGKGYGTFLMDELERIIFNSDSEIIADASLSAYEMYIHRDYAPQEYHRIQTENGHYLCYHGMKKTKDL